MCVPRIIRPRAGWRVSPDGIGVTAAAVAVAHVGIAAAAA